MGNGYCCGPRTKEDKFTSIMETLRATGEKFHDDEFPAQASSLIVDWNDSSDDIQEIKDQWEKIEWIRAENITELNDNDEQLKVFQGKIEPNDIKQGALGDCYFLSSLSVTSERPERISNLFITQDVNKEGLFAVKMTKNGETIQVLVDSNIPCLNGKPVFSAANGNELWVIILEKAWAKIHGSYERIIGGQAHQTLRDLLGAPSFEHETTEEGMWERILQSDQEDHIMAAGVDNDEEPQKLEQIGLVGGHSYGLIAAATVQSRGQDVNIVQLRNPWGQFEWQGDWGDKSDLWTEQSKAQVGFQDVDDGTFWMAFDDFKTHFSRVQICKYKNGFQFSHEKVKSNMYDFNLIKFQICDGGPQTISISQKDERCMNRRSLYEYSNCRIIVMKLLNNQDMKNGVTFLKGTKGYQERDTYIEFDNLNRGTYYAYVEMEWHDSVTYEQRQFNITNYGQGKTIFKGDQDTFKYTNGTDQYEQILFQAFHSKCQQQMDDIQVTNMEEKRAPLITKYECNSATEGFNFVIIENKESEAVYKENVEYTTADGLEIVLGRAPDWDIS